MSLFKGFLVNLFLTPIPDSPMNLLTIGMIGIISGILIVKGFTFFDKRYNKNNSHSDECLPMFIGGLLGGIIGIATGF